MIRFRFIHEETGDYDGEVTISLDTPVAFIHLYCQANGLSSEIVEVRHVQS